MNDILFFLFGISQVLPKNTLTVRDLSRIERFQKEVEVLENQYGYRQVHVAEEDNIDLALAAGRRALDAAGVGADEIDQVIVCGHFEDAEWQRIGQFRLHEGLALRQNCTVFDIKTGNCAGLMQGVEVAQSILCAGHARHILLIGSDKVNTRFVKRRIARRLFGDGACAMVAAAQAPGGQFRGPALELLGRPVRYVDPAFYRIDRLDPATEAAMLDAFLRANAAVISALLAQTAAKSEEIGLLLTSNYDRRFWHHALDAEGIPRDRWFSDNMAEIGHVPVSDLFMNYLAAREKGRTHPGQRCLFLSAGLGLSVHGALFRDVTSVSRQ